MLTSGQEETLNTLISTGAAHGKRRERFLEAAATASILFGQVFSSSQEATSCPSPSHTSMQAGSPLPSELPPLNLSLRGPPGPGPLTADTH